MKICFIATQAGEYGGSEVLWYMTAREALLKNIKVLISAHVSYLEHSQLQELVSLGAKLHIRHDVDLKPFINKIRYKIKCYIPSLNVFAKITKFNPDMIIVSQRGTYDAALQLMMFQFLIKSRFPFLLISQFHKENKAELPENLKLRAKKLFETARRVYFVSERNKIASEATIGSTIRNGYVINNPIRLNVDQITWPTEDVFYVACVARINFEIKRQHLLIKVFAQEKWRNRNIKLNIYGSGQDAIALNIFIEQFSLEKQITMFGQVDDIRGIWEHNHLFILPSVAEGLPLALIEANLFGRAAITTKVGDNEKLVLSGETGFLIEDFSEEALDCALEEAWAKRNSWKDLGSSAKRHALQTLDTNIHKTLLSHIINFANE